MVCVLFGLNLLDIWLRLVDHQFAAGTVLFLPQVNHNATVADWMTENRQNIISSIERMFEK